MEEPAQHEQEPTPAASERRRDPGGFGEAAQALIGAGPDAGRSGAEAQVQRLINWAQACAKIIAEQDFERLELISDETGEHEVRYRQGDQRAVKRTWPGTFGMVPEWSPAGWKPASATPLEYLNRFVLHNALFLDDVRLEGLIVTHKPSRIPGTIPVGCSLVISQRWLVAADLENPYPGEEAIASYLSERGFSPLRDSFFGWFREADGVLILDAKPDNFILTPDGLLPFDLVIVRCGDPVE